MTPYRAAAAAAAILTALILQAGLITPLTAPIPVSLPAVLVAAVALVNGPGTGMAFGFAAGLLADLGSAHPAGILAVSWLALGICAGMFSESRLPYRGRVALCGVGAGVAAIVGDLLLTATGYSGGGVGSTLRDAIPAAVGDGLLALGVLALTARMLASPVLRPVRLRQSGPRRPTIRTGGRV